jgi:MSHA pilin protein MshA
MIRSNQRGFTLIELVVVIVILGILAAFAVPKFMGLENQARISAVNAMGGSLRSAATMAHGVQEATGAAPNTSITIAGNPNPIAVTMINGYPTATAAGIGALLQDSSGFTINAAGNQFTPKGAKTANCWVQYNASPNANSTYTVTYAGLGANATQVQIQQALQNNC